MMEIVVMASLLFLVGSLLTATGSISSVVQVAGLAINSTVSRAAEGVIGQEVTLPAGSTGTLSTRTDDDTGVCSVASGHGLTTDDFVDVYWEGGVHYGADVTAVNTDDISIDLGDGDVLPAQDTAVVVTKRVTIDIDFDGDLVEVIGMASTKRAHVEFEESGGTEIMAQEIPALEGWNWVAGQGVANPLTGNPVGQVSASCGDGTNDATLKIGVLYDSV